MKRILIITLLLLCALPALAQQPTATPSPTPQYKVAIYDGSGGGGSTSNPEQPAPQLTEAQQKLVADSIAQSERVTVELRAAQQRVEALQADAVPLSVKLQATLELLEVKARAETAQARIASNIYFVMAEMRTPPSEYELRPAKNGGYQVVRKDASPKK